MSAVPPLQKSSDRSVYSFGLGKAEGTASMRDLLGGKGANLAEMSLLGLPVPPGFTISTEVCRWYYGHEKTYPAPLQSEVENALKAIESVTAMKFGDPSKPLLVSVRSGARASMPGMMDTVLNLGLNDETAAGLAARTGDARFAYDSYRRFIQMFANVVLGIGSHHFEEILSRKKDALDINLDTELSATDLQQLVEDYKQEVRNHQNGTPFPADPKQQLWQAIGAVFQSWMNPRAITYRRLNDIPADWGTAVTVQSMVFGNMGNDCATGVAFTRNPSTGENCFYGEYLVNAQGEDVVAGIRTPQQLTIAGRHDQHSQLPAMEESMPAIYEQLLAVRLRLESHFHDLQDIEFTVQQGKLYLLQTRNGKRTAQAALRIAVEMVGEGLIDRNEALKRIDPRSLEQSLHPRLDPKAERILAGSGLPASPGAASGKVVFSADEAETLAGKGEDVILVRIETSPEDIHGMHAARGILTTRGGMTSHAAVVARGMGRPCVAGAGGLRIDYLAGTITCLNYAGSGGGTTGGTGTDTAGNPQPLVIRAGEIITLDGMSGQVFLGKIPTLQPEFSSDFNTLMGWADEVRQLRVRANAETELDARVARNFGAEGIGLCRTEHMFFDDERIVSMREMILAETVQGRSKALAKLLPMQRGDFKSLFTIMAGLPVTIRLLDPPLHEFLPHSDAEIREVAKASNLPEAMLRARANALHESNPMLGHRGCRLGISYPEIYEMQVRAIFEAVIELAQENPNAPLVIPEIMIPLVATKREFEIMRELVDRVATEIGTSKNLKLHYLVGTMIELPRACLEANRIAESAEFFSFGTNDLTQTSFGLSRDDAGSFLGTYVERGILPHDPFVSIDQAGVGALMEIAVTRGRQTRPEIKLGICGEHGGDPDSIHFCNILGLDYVSCSPYRVPIARLAAAQAALKLGYDRRDR